MFAFLGIWLPPFPVKCYFFFFFLLPGYSVIVLIWTDWFWRSSLNRSRLRTWPHGKTESLALQRAYILRAAYGVWNWPQVSFPTFILRWSEIIIFLLHTNKSSAFAKFTKRKTTPLLTFVWICYFSMKKKKLQTRIDLLFKTLFIFLI